MTVATSPKPSPRSHRLVRPSSRLGCDQPRPDRSVLGRYTDRHGRHREVLARAGHGGSVLVVDRDARTLGDGRLVAHLAADEPAANAKLVCRHYLSDPRGRWCRRISPEDLLVANPGADSRSQSDSDGVVEPLVDRDPNSDSHSDQDASALVDRHERMHRLGLVRDRLSIPELRWLRFPAGELGAEPQPVSIREVVASFESYEPARSLTIRALARHRADPAVSVAVLRAELDRMDASRIVLNRGLRDAVLSVVRTQGLSMSEIALRCGRVKYDARGNVSGETSWLARRVGISPEGGEREPTPWVHSDVLALIARAGLGVSPREVELG